jgi:hypothetical protein
VIIGFNDLIINDYSYQLAFVTPGILPFSAISRNIFLDKPKMTHNNHAGSSCKLATIFQTYRRSVFWKQVKSGIITGSLSAARFSANWPPYYFAFALAGFY